MYGTSNTFVKVTDSVIKKCKDPLPVPDSIQCNKVKMTCVHQDVPSSCKFTTFEMILDGIENKTSTMDFCSKNLIETIVDLKQFYESNM